VRHESYLWHDSFVWHASSHIQRIHLTNGLTLACCNVRHDSYLWHDSFVWHASSHIQRIHRHWRYWHERLLWMWLESISNSLNVTRVNIADTLLTHWVTHCGLNSCSWATTNTRPRVWLESHTRLLVTRVNIEFFECDSSQYRWHTADTLSHTLWPQYRLVCDSSHTLTHWVTHCGLNSCSWATTNTRPCVRLDHTRGLVTRGLVSRIHLTNLRMRVMNLRD